ncbi:hypothetical protein ACFOYU_22520 [Microvirga sp. GCM10011540]|uniref:hypothetical protein n=1 Tax=Microvirga sp. GCM10011540 TaxID=3317338 RepID=UPI00361B0BF0
MTTELHKGPLEPASTAAAPATRLSWRQEREIRRRRRVWFEEILGWILVPVIVVGSYWLVETVLNALGTSVDAIIEGLGAITSNL